MIFLDANIFLRFVAPAETAAQKRMQDTAEYVFGLLDRSQLEATTSEVVLHEVCYVLTSKKQYSLTAAQAITAIEPILRLRSLKFPSGDREIYLRALEVWKSNPRLEFSDSVIAARCETNGWELATFDEQLGSLPNLTRWNPAPTA